MQEVARGYQDGLGSAAQFNYLISLATDEQGNIYAIDGLRIRKIDPTGLVTTFAGDGTPGSADGTGTAAQFSMPQGLTVDKDGNIYVAESTRIRKITPGGVVTTVAGSDNSGYADGTGAAAMFMSLLSIAADADGNLFVTDYLDNRIRKITPAGVVTTFAGTGVNGTEDGPIATAKFGQPVGIAIDESGNIFIAQWENGALRKISTNGMVSTFFIECLCQPNRHK